VTTDVRPERLRDLLNELVDIYSPSGKEEEVLSYIEAYLKGYGLNVIRQGVDENRFNLLVLPGDAKQATLAFVGHVDTVAAHDLDDYGFRAEGDTIFGLGTSDMKGGCAAMIEAFTVLASVGGAFPPVGLALLVGEEEDNDGAKTLVGEYGFPWAVVGEPTNMAPCLGHYGYVEAVLRTRGKRAHSSMPELGHNAIEAMLRLLLCLTDYASSAPHGLVYNIRELSGFPGGFVVPDMCEAWLDLHLPPESGVDILKSELARVVEAASQDIPYLDADLEFEDTYNGYRLPAEGPFVMKLRAASDGLSLPWAPQDFRSHSDANVLWAAGTAPVIVGPGRLEAAHTAEESVSCDQVVQAARLYLKLALAL